MPRCCDPRWSASVPAAGHMTGSSLWAGCLTTTTTSYRYWLTPTGWLWKLGCILHTQMFQIHQQWVLLTASGFSRPGSPQHLACPPSTSSSQQQKGVTSGSVPRLCKMRLAIHAFSHQQSSCMRRWTSRTVGGRIISQPTSLPQPCQIGCHHVCLSFITPTSSRPTSRQWLWMTVTLMLTPRLLRPWCTSISRQHHRQHHQHHQQHQQQHHHHHHYQ